MLLKKVAHLVLMGIVLISCNAQRQKSPELLYTAYCGGCHVAPEVQHITRNLWEESVLPEMAARLGYQFKGYNPLWNYSMTEGLHIKMTGSYPQSALIDSASWSLLYDWIIAQAPESIPVDTSRSSRNGLLTLFDPEPISLDTVDFATVT